MLNMCGRFVLVTDLTKIAERFNVQQASSNFQSSWNVSPGQYIPAVIQRSGQNILESFLWGLIPSWAKDPSIGHKLINARAETIGEKPSFRTAFKKRRCLIVADGFYEWKHDGQKKVPWYFYLKSGEPFGLAGLYETWMSGKKPINTCTIITTDANELISPVHSRMPVIVPEEQEQTWLRDDMEDKAALLAVLKPYPAEKMDYKVGMGPEFAQDE
jgi:putative SOS response-associated peptidase YedK